LEPTKPSKSPKHAVWPHETRELVEQVAKPKKAKLNIELKRFWENFYSLQEPAKIPITVNWGRSFYATMLGIDLIRIF